MTLLSLQEVAESFGVEESTVRDWAEHDNLPHVVDRDRLLFNVADVASWAEGFGVQAKVGFFTTESSELSEPAGVSELLRNGGIWRDVPVSDARATLEKVVSKLAGVAEPVRHLLGQRLQSDEGLVWAAVGHGFALPHLSARVALGRAAGVIALITLDEVMPLDDPTPDGEPVDRLLFFIPPTPREHLDFLARLSRLVDNPAFRAAVDRADGDAEVFRLVAEADAEGGVTSSTPNRNGNE